MSFLTRLRQWRNPHGETRLHLAALARRRGFEIGAYSYGAPKVRFAGTGARLVIGRFCSIADRVEIFLGGNHRTDWISTYPFDNLPGLWPAGSEGARSHVTRGDVLIGSDVWIGSGATILSGVTIGHGAVIGTRAVVSRSVPPYAIVAGNPAAVLRLRFDPAAVEALVETAWWDLERGQIEELIPLLQSGRVEELIAAVRAIRGG